VEALRDVGRARGAEAEYAPPESLLGALAPLAQALAGLLQLGRVREAQLVGAFLLERGQALELLRAAEDQTAAPVRLATAKAELMAGRPAAAVAMLKGLVDEQPGSVAAHLALAQAYERNAQPVASRQSLKRALAIAPEEPQVRYVLLRHLLLQPRLPKEELDQAVADAIAFSEAYPRGLRREVLRALVMFRLDDQREPALALLGQIQQTRPSTEMASLLANLYTVVGRPEAAVELLNQRVTMRPEDTYARLRLARAQLAAGAFGSAADNLVLSLEKGARQEGLALATAWALAKAGRPADARAYLNQAEDEGARGTMLLHTQALLRLSDGDARGAVTSLQEAVDGAIGTPSVQLRLDLAKAMAAAGQRAPALQALAGLSDDELSAAERAERDTLAAGLR
jgi:Flp pilus assembly protein TadD